MAEKNTGLAEKLTPILLFASIILAFAVGILWQKVSNLERGGNLTATQTADDQQTQAQGKVDIEQVRALFEQALIKFGDSNRKVLFVEVTDPSCPYCHAAAGKNPELNRQLDPGGRFRLVGDGGTYLAPVQEIKKLVDEEEASLVYIYSPGHGNGEMAMRALYCAYEMDKFWEVHDLLYTNDGYDLINGIVRNDKSQSQKLADFLKNQIDPDQLRSCVDSERYDQRLSTDASLASSLGVTGTPGFFVNDKFFAGAYSFKDMEPEVDQALGE